MCESQLSMNGSVSVPSKWSSRFRNQIFRMTSIEVYVNVGTCVFLSCLSFPFTKLYPLNELDDMEVLGSGSYAICPLPGHRMLTISYWKVRLVSLVGSILRLFVTIKWAWKSSMLLSKNCAMSLIFHPAWCVVFFIFLYPSFPYKSRSPTQLEIHCPGLRAHSLVSIH